jgi:transposase
VKNSQKHPVPYRNAVRRFIEKFSETGSILDAERIGRPSKFNDKISKAILQKVFVNKFKQVQAYITAQRLSERTVHCVVYYSTMD